MFGWFKKKKNKDGELKIKLANSLAKYAAEQEDTTDTTFTDVEIDGVSMKIPKYTAKPVERLTMDDFNTPVDNRVGATVDKKDPWATANPAETGRWKREETNWNTARTKKR